MWSWREWKSSGPRRQAVLCAASTNIPEGIYQVSNIFVITTALDATSRKMIATQLPIIYHKWIWAALTYIERRKEQELSEYVVQEKLWIWFNRHRRETFKESGHQFKISWQSQLPSRYQSYLFFSLYTYRHSLHLTWIENALQQTKLHQYSYIF